MARRRRARGLRGNILRDFEPACQVRLLVGGRVGKLSKPGRSVTVDPERLSQRVEELVAQRFKASTHTRARGFWKGDGEPSVVVDLLDLPDQKGSCQHFAQQARCTARAIARELSQDAVGVVTSGPNGPEVDFVTSKSVDGKACRVEPGSAADARAAIRRIRRG